MRSTDIKDIVLEILRDAKGKFLLSYQIYEEIQKRDPVLARRLEQEYSVAPGNPSMGHGAGIPYSLATFISKALASFKKKDDSCKTLLRIERIEPKGLKDVSGAEAGNPKALAIWAWDTTKKL